MSFAWNGYDCLDIGADTNSLSWARSHLGAKRPLGLSIDLERLSRMRQSEEACVELNALKIPTDIEFDYVMMSHFIEHLENKNQIITVFRSALRIAKKAVYIGGPYFEADDYIREYGVKFTWGDWVDHASRYSLRTILPWLQEVMQDRISVSLGFPVLSSDADNIVALSERANLDSYDREATVQKPSVTFSRPAFQEFLVIVAMADGVDSGSIHIARHGRPGTVPQKIIAAAPWPE